MCLVKLFVKNEFKKVLSILSKKITFFNIAAKLKTTFMDATKADLPLMPSSLHTVFTHHRYVQTTRNFMSTHKLGLRRLPLHMFCVSIKDRCILSIMNDSLSLIFAWLIVWLLIFTSQPQIVLQLTIYGAITHEINYAAVKWQFVGKRGEENSFSFA